MKKELRGVYISSAVAIFLFFALNFICYSILKEAFQFPEILRRPAAEVLQLFQQNRSIIIPAYYGYTLTGLIFVFISVLLYRSFENRDSAVIQLTTVCGIFSGLFQMLGFVRWPFLKPYLASVFADTASSEAARAAASVVYESFNRYAGMGAGENLGHVTWGIWVIGISLVMLNEKLFDRKLGWIGIPIGIGYLVYSLEQLGIAALEFLVVPVYAAFGVWQLVMAYSLIRTDAETGRGPKLGWITLLISVVLFLIIAGPAFVQ